MNTKHWMQFFLGGGMGGRSYRQEAIDFRSNYSL